MRVKLNIQCPGDAVHSSHLRQSRLLPHTPPSQSYMAPLPRFDISVPDAPGWQMLQSAGLVGWQGWVSAASAMAKVRCPKEPTK